MGRFGRPFGKKKRGSGISTPTTDGEGGHSTTSVGSMEEVPVGSGGTGPSTAIPGPQISHDSKQKTDEIKKKVEDVTSIMQQNIDKTMERGETMENLEEKTRDLEGSSKLFSKNARTVRKNLWWKNMKMGIIIACIILLIIALIVGYFYLTRNKPK